MGAIHKYEAFIPALKEVYRLSILRKSLPKTDPIERILKGEPYSEPVYDYLMTQNLDTVKFVETVMYIGRDYQEPELTEEEYQREVDRMLELAAEGITEQPRKLRPVANPDIYIERYMEQIFSNKQTCSQSVEANQISSKAVLDQYLKRAFIILGI